MQAAEQTIQNIGIGGGSGVAATAVSPHDGSLVLAASTRGTVFITRNAGATWTLIHGDELSSSQNCRPLFDPEDKTTIYAASGSTIKVSRDKGRTWKPLPEGVIPWKSEGVTHLALESTGKKTMYAGTAAGMFRSDDHGKRWRQIVGFNGPCAGIVTLPGHTFIAFGNAIHETADGGSTWSQRRIAATDRRITGLTGGYTKGGRMVLYAAVPGVGVLGSETMARTWSTVFPQPTVEEVAMACDQDKVAFAVSQDAVWKTDNGGALWLKYFTTAGDAAMPEVRHSWPLTDMGRTCKIFPGSVSASTWDIASVVLGTEGEVYVSRNAGKTWAPAINTPRGKIPLPQGEAARSATGTTAERTRSANLYASVGFEANAAWEYYIHPRRRQYAMIAYSDTGLALSADQGSTWFLSVDGSPAKSTFYNLAFDPFSETRVYAAVSDQPDIPAWSQIDHVLDSGGVAVSDDCGQFWRPAGTGLPRKPCTWVTVDPKSTKGSVTLYAAVYGEGVYKSSDGGKTWTSKSNGLGRAGNKNAFMVKVHPKTGDVYCSITGVRKDEEPGPPGGLWRSADGGDTWEDLTAKLNLHWPAGFELDPRNPTIIYLAAGAVPSSPAEGGLYKTTTGGTSWNQVFKASNLAADAATGQLCCWFVSVSPHNNDHVYLSTQEHGLYFSQDNAMNWSRVDWVPCRSVTRVSFAPFDKTCIYVSTFGGGVWKGPAGQARGD